MENYVPMYKWAQKIKNLDGNVCAFYGGTYRLQAHHIIPRSVKPDEANNLENGITLRYYCHYFAHDMGFHKARKEFMKPISDGPNCRAARITAFIQDYVETSVILRLPKGTKERWKAAAEKAGVSMTKYVLDTIEAAIEAQDH